jgi:hypothetical protein
MMVFMQRDELIGALQARLAQLGAHLRGVSFTRDGIQDGADGADGRMPEHVREILDFMIGRARAEQDWTKALIRKLKAGAYRLAGEGGLPPMGPGLGAQGPVDESRH